MSDRTEKELLDEICALTQLVAEQERAVADAADEVRRSHATLSWRIHLRVEKASSHLMRNPILREPYRAVRRAIEIWVEHGFLYIFKFGVRKIGQASRGRPLVVDDHFAPPDVDAYDKWLKQHRPTAEAYAAMRAATAALREPPQVSILMTAGGAEVAPLRRTLESIQAQVYGHWELLVALPAAASAAVTSVVSEIAGDPRTRLLPCEAPAQGEAFHASRGSVIALVETGDVLAPEALFEVIARFNDDPAAQMVYSDQDSIGVSGRRTDPFFKPEWDPLLLLSMNFLGPFTAMRRRLVDEAGGFRPELGPGQSYDLVLRASERTVPSRVAKVLCHLGPRETTRDAIAARHAAGRAERRAIEDALARRRRPGCVETLFTSRGPRCYVTRFRLEQRPLVSIIIPTRDQSVLLRTTIESLLNRTSYDRYEVIVVDNDSRDPEAQAYLASLQPPCRVHRWAHPFNYSAINNAGARAARGEQLLFLNNDVEVIEADWLTALLEHAQFADVGAVGAKLLYKDGTIQHAGVVLMRVGLAQHAFARAPKDVPGVPRLADVPRNCSAVTGACLMVPRRVFDEVGGFDEDLRVVLNDVDLCLRIRERGYEVVYTPHALLYHYEGASRGRLHPPADEERFLARWSSRARMDPFYNPNLSDRRGDWVLNLNE